MTAYMQAIVEPENVAMKVSEFAAKGFFLAQDVALFKTNKHPNETPEDRAFILVYRHDPDPEPELVSEPGPEPEHGPAGTGN